jgi:DNA polymerase-3 subunit gamma/tau
VKFIFATTEPEKVISTIRSRTHHYPFRLVPPAQMLDYVQQLCESEGVAVQPGVLPLVVRAGGGSVRDTLSLLDQLIAGSEASDGTITVEYERAVALLGYTHGALLDEVVDAVAAQDAAAAFASVDRVVQTGQDPRRFVEDLLERLRDLIVVLATRDGAASVLRGVPQDELDHMATQAQAFGAAELSRAADIVNTALTEMTGATSPRLHLELMVARLLVPASDDSARGALARVERLERRIGIDDSSAGRVAAPSGGRVAAPAPSGGRVAAPETSVGRVAAPEAPRVETPAAHPPADEPPAQEPPAPPATPVTTAQLRDAWPEVLEALQRSAGRLSWAVVSATTVHSFADDVLTLGFPNESDALGFKQARGTKPGESVSEQLRAAILEVLGVRVKFLTRVEPAAVSQAAATEPEPAAAEPADEEPAAAPARSGWNVVAIPDAAPTEPEPVAAAPEPAAEQSGPSHPAGSARYGEAVVREILGASFLEETSVAPRDRPVPLTPEPAEES